MKHIHQLSGLPRSGSTLLGNILSQHPEIHVSGTSPLYNVVDNLVTTLTKSPEVVAQLANIPGSYERYVSATKALMQEWYSHVPEEHIFDKSRGWPGLRSPLEQIDDESIMICCVRDPRDIIASIEKQNRKTGMFKHEGGDTLYDMSSNLMSAQGVVGGPLHLAEDLIRRKRPCAWVQYERFTMDPTKYLRDILGLIGLDPDFEFDLENVENVSQDLDPLYKNKYPHEGSGKVRPAETAWQDFMSVEIANLVANVSPLFMHTFGYELSQPGSATLPDHG